MILKNVWVASLCIFVCISCDNKTADQQEGEAMGVESTGQPEETEAEEVALFDGTSLEHWRNFKKQDINWKIEEGALTTPGGQGDIVTKEQYENFELDFDWKISEGGNSGVMYLVQEGDNEESYHTGPEYQIIDAENFTKKHNYPLEDDQKTGANYDVDPPKSGTVKAAGEWNHSKIVVNKGKVEHWLNDEKVVEYELWSDEWKQKVSQTKFKEWPVYGMAKSGHIALQDHGDQVWYKNIVLKKL